VSYEYDYTLAPCSICHGEIGPNGECFCEMPPGPIRSGLKIGELFAGYNGLGMAVEEVFGATTAWFSEFDTAPSKILAHHYPSVPNYGDVTAIDWFGVESVDIMSGGSPCQDLSLAGRRKGMTEGTRSNLWESMREGIAIIRPKYVVWENVRGALSAGAISEMEQSEGRVGADGDPNLRAIGRVLGDLADLGYDAEWRGLRAADVGAAHNRFRVFLLAALPDAGGVGLEAGRLPRRPAAEVPEPTDHQSLLSYAYNLGYERGREARDRGLGPADDRLTLADAESLGWREGWAEPAGVIRRLAAASDSSSTADSASARRAEGQDGGTGGGNARQGIRSLESERGSRERTDATADASSATIREYASESSTEEAGPGSGDGSSNPRGIRPAIDWGLYAPAVRRWERVNGPSPRPTEPSGRDGGHRLSPAFVEWMMGLPAGWVTDVPGVNRNGQLKALGNGVVKQQAVAALSDMLAAFNS
jgi:DNA (cytosine-5)-methyltransferase 1